MKLHWRFGIIAGLFLAVFSLYPQMRLIYLRGGDWQGNYAFNDADEAAYAAYINALIEGRPRKNDPYTGRDDSPSDPQPESLFSIQFAAPYTIAIPARILGIPATWAMTISGALAAFLTALAVFWLLGMVIGDSLFAMAGSLFVLVGGAVFAGEGAIGKIFGGVYAYPYFPGFRRYVPALAFPAFFAMTGLVWKLIGREPAVEAGPTTATRPVVVPVYFLLASVAFGYMVFSYFYVWTAALAWIGCIGICWLIARPPGVWSDLRLLGGLVISFLVFLVPYAFLLSSRAPSMDDVQLLVYTRAPDLFRVPELIGFGVLVLIAVAVRLKMFAFREKPTLFAVSLALLPLAVFNQQIVTGRALQPIHYQVFIANYVAGLAFVTTLGLIWRTADGRDRAAGKLAMAGFALVAVIWGFTECYFTIGELDTVNVERDRGMPVARRLSEIGKGDPDKYKQVVLHFGVTEADDLPSLAPQAEFWAPHQAMFSGGTRAEAEERFFKYLYYLKVKGPGLYYYLRTDYVTIAALFGWDRHSDRLSSEARPLTQYEISDEVSRYEDYCRYFSMENAAEPRISYVVVPAGNSVDLSNVIRWYDLDEGEMLGDFTLYRATLREQKQ